jgi:hypothetical protein
MRRYKIQGFSSEEPIYRQAADALVVTRWQNVRRALVERHDALLSQLFWVV